MQVIVGIEGSDQLEAFLKFQEAVKPTVQIVENSVSLEAFQKDKEDFLGFGKVGEHVCGASPKMVRECAEKLRWMKLIPRPARWVFLCSE